MNLLLQVPESAELLLVKARRLLTKEMMQLQARSILDCRVGRRVFFLKRRKSLPDSTLSTLDSGMLQFDWGGFSVLHLESPHQILS